MKEIILPSGKIAQIRKGKGRDIVNAQRITSESSEVTLALVSELTTIDGNKLLFEDLLEMDLEDVCVLLGEVTGKNASALQKV